VTEKAPFVLVHGAWHGSWAWDLITERLRHAGHDVIAVDLPSSGPDPTTLGDFDDDVAVVRAALDALRTSPIVVGHSYGGQVISAATARRADIARLVYICAFMLDVGESTTSALADQPAEWVEPLADGVAVRVTDPVAVFYGDVEPDLAQRCARRLHPQSVAAATATLPAAGWHDIPSRYVICEQDQAIPVSVQETMSRHADDVVRLDASHSPFLSRPDELIALLL
jgi:pimeloyl-ACP methyl ester carboxylesterase